MNIFKRFYIATFTSRVDDLLIDNKNLLYAVNQYIIKTEELLNKVDKLINNPDKDINEESLNTVSKLFNRIHSIKNDCIEKLFTNIEVIQKQIDEIQGIKKDK